MDQYLVFARDLAKQAGDIIKKTYESNLAVELKADRTPVTEADKAINELVIAAVKDKYPDHGLMGEEANHGTGKEEYRWICDPLDGTKAFTLGVPLTTFILGLTRNSELVLSVVYSPFSDRLYHAVKGEGAFCNDQSLHVNDQRLEDDGCVIVSESSYQYIESIKQAGGTIEVLPGAGYRSMLIATGRCVGSIQGKAVLYDVGPVSLIIEEAGGRVTDLSGKPLQYDSEYTNGVVLSNGLAHEKLLKITA